jgi:hypothetical protein
VRETKRKRRREDEKKVNSKRIRKIKIQKIYEHK